MDQPTSGRYDPEFAAAIKPIEHLLKRPVTKDVLELQSMLNAMPLPPELAGEGAKMGVVQTKIADVPTYNGATIELFRFSSPKMDADRETTPQPAIVYVHGGGMIACTIAQHSGLISWMAGLYDMPFYAMEWRWAPQHPAPAGAEDAFAGFKYVSDHAGALGVDAARIILMGHSGGGGLAASAAQMARDRCLSPPLAKQLLCYPMIDDRYKVAPDSVKRPLLYWWSPEEDQLAWEAVLGKGKAGNPDADVPEYAVPGRIKDVSGLPPTYIEVGTMDTVLVGVMQYAARLAAADNELELYVKPGLPHGFEGMRQTSWAMETHENRKRFIRKW